MNRQERRHPRCGPEVDREVGQAAFTVVEAAGGGFGVEICWDLPREYTDLVALAFMEAATKFGGLDLGGDDLPDAPGVTWVEGPHQRQA